MSGDGGADSAEARSAIATETGWLHDYVRDVPDFPEPGVQFRDITPLLADADSFRRAVDELADRFAGVQVDRVVGIEARGFILAAPIAYRLGAAFAPVRKAGKLPWAVVREEFVLEYRSDKLELHRDAIHPGERILVIDDVLATGGTAAATVRLIETLGGVVVGVGVLIELTAFDGRSQLGDHRLEAIGRF